MKHPGVGAQNGMLRLDGFLVSRLFEQVIREIVNHIETLLRNPQLQHQCHLLFLVGGFGEIPILKDEIENRFAQMEIYAPRYADLAEAMGAVLFGHEIQNVKSRIIRKTYGCKAVRYYDGNIHHDKTNTIVIGGTRYIDNVFAVFVSKGDELDIGIKSRHRFQTTSPHCQEVNVALYCMDRKPGPVEYVDGPDVQKLGEFIVATPGKGKGRPVHLDITFSGTEILIESWASGKSTQATIDFLM